MRLQRHTQVNLFQRARMLPAQAMQVHASKSMQAPAAQASKGRLARMLARARAWIASGWAFLFGEPDRPSMGKPIMARRIKLEDPHTKRRRKLAERSRRYNRLHA